MSDTSNHWFHYISGIKKLLKLTCLESNEKTSDIAALLYWASYHDTLSRFSLGFWEHRHQMKDMLPQDSDILKEHLKGYERRPEVCLRHFT